MKITSPIPHHTARTFFGSLVVEFKDGVADIEDALLTDGLRLYLDSNGYGVGDHAAAEPSGEPDVPVDSRSIPAVVEGAPLRDAAVDPRPEDYLPPVNAGQADPHGPQVVAPGIHAVSGAGPIHPGPVGVSGTDSQGRAIVVKDTDAQAANETKLASDVFVDQLPVHVATARAAGVDPLNEDASPADTGGVFDPANHTVPEVNEHLSQADEAEKLRVFTAELEENGGKGRAGILGGPHADTDD